MTALTLVGTGIIQVVQNGHQDIQHIAALQHKVQKFLKGIQRHLAIWSVGFLFPQVRRSTNLEQELEQADQQALTVFLFLSILVFVNRTNLCSYHGADILLICWICVFWFKMTAFVLCYMYPPLNVQLGHFGPTRIFI